MQRTQDDQAAWHLPGLGGELIHLGLQKRTEVEQLFAVEVLEFVEGDDVSLFGEFADEAGEFLEAGDAPVDAEGFEVAVAGGDDTGGVGVGDLDVEGAVDAGVLEGLLDQGGFADAAAAGDVVAQQVWLEIADWLGTAISSIAWLLNPDAFVIGGGVAQAGDLLFAPLKRKVQSMLSTVVWERLQILPARYSNEAGIIGNAALAADAEE